MIFEKKTIDQRLSEQLLNRLRKRTILPQAAKDLDKKISTDEVREKMENHPLGKQAGPNRVPNAVYRFMSATFAPLLTKVLNDTIRKGKLPNHFLEGDIAMLYKKGGWKQMRQLLINQNNMVD